MVCMYKGFRISKGDPKFTHEVFTIKKGRGRTEQYFGGADTVKLAKDKIDKMLEKQENK